MRNSSCLIPAVLILIVGVVAILLAITPQDVQTVAGIEAEKVHGQEVSDLTETIQVVSDNGVKAQKVQAEAVISALLIAAGMEITRSFGSAIPWVVLGLLGWVLINRLTAPKHKPAVDA